MELEFAGYREAAPDHPPSVHRCITMPATALTQADQVVILCAECDMVWYTSCTFKASDYAVFADAEMRYGGKPHQVGKSTLPHPLWDVYLLEAGQRRCLHCTYARPIAAFITEAGVDRHSHVCQMCRASNEIPLALTAEELQRVRAKFRTDPQNHHWKSSKFGKHRKAG